MKKKTKIIKGKIIDAYCVISRRSMIIKNDLMGTLQNPYYSIHPQTAQGKKYAEDNCNGYEVVVPCRILIDEIPQHKCNCEYCDKK